MAAPLVFAIASAAGGIGKGMAAKRESKALARQAELDAKSEEVARMRELNDALAMQNLMFGASGVSAGVGSAKDITEESMREFGKDVKMIQAGGRAKAAGLRGRGHRSLLTSIGGGAADAGMTYHKFSQIGGKKGE